MITLTATDRVSIRGRVHGFNCNNKVNTDILFSSGEWNIMQKALGEENLCYYSMNVLTGRTVTVPVLYEIIAQSRNNILIKFKEKEYIVGKNLICMYDSTKDEIKPMMIHMIKTKVGGLRGSKIVFNPDLFAVDSAFKKLFEIVLQTGVDIELTKFIEEKYYFRADLPKFGNLTDRKKFVTEARSWMLEELLKIKEI